MEISSAVSLVFAWFCFCIYAAGKCVSFCCGTHYCSPITTQTTSKFNNGCLIVWLCWQQMWRNHTQTSRRAHELMLDWGCFLTYLHPVNRCNKTGMLVKPFFRVFPLSNLSRNQMEIPWTTTVVRDHTEELLYPELSPILCCCSKLVFT